jgi:hypothetical protein
VISTPAPDCWLHPGLDVHASAIEGRGLFARVPIPAGTVVSRLGGRLVSPAELDRLIADPALGYIDTIMVSETEHLVLPRRRGCAVSGAWSFGGRGEPAPLRDTGYGNHSCDPNLWWVGPYELAARRDIAAGDEVTNDYATSTGDPRFTMECACGADLCRGTVTGDDWRRPELRERYGDHWIPALLARIRSSSADNA